MALLVAMRHHSVEQLIAILSETRQVPLVRVAALRWLIGAAPIEVTRGAPYLTRRRYVRQHFHV